MVPGNAEAGVIVDAELDDEPGLLNAEDSTDPPESTDATASTATDGADPDLPTDADGDLEVEDLPADRATADPTGQPAPAAAATTEERKPVTPVPFTFKGDKGEHTLDGAQYYAGDGLYIPDAAVPRVKQLLATAAFHNGSWQREKRELTRQIEHATKGRTEKDVAADALMDLVFKDLGSLQTDDDVYEWAVKFRQNLPEYRVKIREQQLQHREQQLELRQQPDPEEVEAAYVAEASEELGRTFTEIWKFPEMKVLDAEDRKQLVERFGPKARQFVTVVDADDPQRGVKKGDRIFDGASLLEQVRIAAAIKQRTVDAAKAASDAAAANARKLGLKGPKARVAAPATDSAPPAEGARPRDEKGRFQTREEWEAYMRDEK